MSWRAGLLLADALFQMSVVGSLSVSPRGRTDNAFSRRAGHASISALDVRTGRLQWGTAVHWRASQDSVHAGSIAAASAATKIGRMPLTRGSLTSPSTPSDLMTLILEARPFSVLLRTVFYRESYREA